MKRQLVDRRAILAASAATVLAASTLGHAEPIEDPILPVFREWVAARTEWYSYADLPDNEDWDSPESTAAEDRETAAFRMLIDMVPSSLAGVAALTCVLFDREFSAYRRGTEDFEADCRQPSARLMINIWHGTSGQPCLPLGGPMTDAPAVIPQLGRPAYV